MFGQDISESFNNTNGLSLVARAHQAVNEVREFVSFVQICVCDAGVRVYARVRVDATDNFLNQSWVPLMFLPHF